MPRIKIQLPEQFNFSTEIPVRISDLNYGGHVGNDTVLTLIHEARVQFLRFHQYTELDIEGVSLIMGDAALEFKAESFYGDSIRIFVTAGDFSRVGFDLYYKLVRTSDGAIIATGKTGMVCFNYTTRKVVSVPEPVLSKFSSFLQPE
jgi:acyl-CoA thioesterase FadM